MGGNIYVPFVNSIKELFEKIEKLMKEKNITNYKVPDKIWLML